MKHNRGGIILSLCYDAMLFVDLTTLYDFHIMGWIKFINRKVVFMASTKISINEGFDNLNMMQLNIAELEKNTEYCKLAYCSDVEVGTTKDSKKFFKFTLFDKGGHMIFGRLFNAEDLENKGLTANNIVGFVVKIRFDVSMFMDTESLRLISIDPIPKSAMSREEFIGSLSGVEEDLTTLSNTVDKIRGDFPRVVNLIEKYNLLDKAETVSMPTLWAERKGGAVKFSAKLMKICEASYEDDELNEVLAVAILAEIFMYWKYASDYEESILSLGDDINKIISKSDRYIDAVMDSAKKSSSEAEYRVCREVKHLLKCYFGYCKPETYISRSLLTMRDNLFNNIQLRSNNDSILRGTHKTFSDANGNLYRIIRL